MIGRTFAHYRITRRLGAGGMGEVYLAHDEHLDRDVAIKVLPAGTLSEDARRQFGREATALSRLNHPHIAAAYDFDTAGGVDFLVMEYVPGATLSERIASAPLAEPAIAAIAGDIAAALEEAHERGVVHRDLKPANIILTPKGRVKVLDFGMAQLSAAGDVDRTITKTAGGFKGTLAYMAPEQLRGDPIDGRTDIYALGVVLFEMATGKRPFDEPHAGRLSDAILHAPIALPTHWRPSLNPELTRITLKCLQRDPDNRYQSAKEVAIDLRALAVPTAVWHPTARGRVLGRRLAFGGMAVVIASVAGVGLWTGLRDRAAAGPLGTPGEIASIVALPSKVAGSASEQFMTDAIPNTISTHLAQVHGLETKVPPSSVEVERVRGDLTRLADAYGVNSFVLTSLTIESERLVLNVQLVDARSRRLLWSRELEGRRDNYLALARGAAEGLRGVIRPAAAPIAPQATTSSEAELAYQRGMHHFNRYNNQHEKTDFTESLTALQRALALEPRMADAAAGLAWLHEFAIEAGAPVAEMLPEVRRWAQLAIDLDQRNSRAWAVMAVTELIGMPSRPRDGLVYALRGAAHGPRDAFAVNGLAIGFAATSASLSLTSAQEAARVDPLYLYPPLNASENLAYLGRFEEALASAETVLRLEPNMPAALIRKGLALIELKRTAEVAELIPILQRQGEEGRADPELVAMVRDGATLFGPDGAGKPAALVRLSRQARHPGPFAEYPRLHAWLIQHGRTDDAFAALEHRARVGRIPYDYLRLAPEFTPLRSDARFARALAIARAQFDETIALLREADARSDLPAFLRQPLADLLRTLGIDDRQPAAASPQR